MNRKLFFVLLLTITLIENSSAKTEFEQCRVAQLKGTLNSIRVTGCDQISPVSQNCTFKIGHNVTFDVDFTPKVERAKLNSRIIVDVYGFWIPWHRTPDNACDYGLKCPIIKDQENKLHMTLTVNPEFAPVFVKLKLILEDDKGKPFVCVQMPVDIVN